MNTMKKRITLLLAAALILVLLSACGNAQPQITGSGTQDDPWVIGEDEYDEVTAFIVEGTLWINGDGDMMDFQSAEARPWNDVIADLTQVSVGGNVRSVGAMAFMGAGKNVDNFVADFYSELKLIGDSAFEGAHFGDNCILAIPETVRTIGARAFANSNAAEIYIDGTPEIADDAFAGVSAAAYVRYDGTWDESNMLPYGGELRYVYTYAVSYTEDYGTDDLSGEGTIYYLAGDTFEYDAETSCADENYHFVRYEMVSGDLELIDPTDPVISAPLMGNVELRIIYASNA